MSSTLTERTARPTDARVQQDVLEELWWDPRISPTEVGVQVKNGVVTLTGTIDSYAKRVAASQAAHRVVGVRDVANDLDVRLPTSAERTDPQIAEAVRRELEWDVFIPHDDIRSTVSRGWVTLEGTVHTLYERQDAERVVARLTGVRGVTNQIRVAPAPLNAEEIRGAITEALERRAVREGRHIRIDVHDGVVTLRGTIRSWTERNAIDRVVAYAPGVKRVDDNLVVDPFS